jgi:hypothetical protein
MTTIAIRAIGGPENSTYPLTEAAEAPGRRESSALIGKIVLTVAE